MQESVNVNKATSMKALMVTGNHLEDIEELMPRLARSLGSGEVAEIANINSRSQVIRFFYARLC
jgi:[acyl-carrier-protein] S-malonyltransferase